MTSIDPGAHYMNTYLLTWNPRQWAWAELPRQARRIAAGESVRDRWSTGRRNSGIGSGDAFFLLRQSVEPRGIVASGRVESEVFRAPHYQQERERQGDESNYVSVRFEALVDPAAWPSRVLPLRVLTVVLPDVSIWRSQSSGVRMSADLAAGLQSLWENHIRETAPFRLPGEIDLQERFVEGAVHTLIVNAYERNQAARRECVQHWGTACVSCGFDFGTMYGDIGRGFIHVHHLKPLADIGEDYEVDPIADLRPLCPNCHAMVHRRDPAFTPEELRSMLRQR